MDYDGRYALHVYLYYMIRNIWKSALMTKSSNLHENKHALNLANHMKFALVLMKCMHCDCPNINKAMTSKS